MYAFNDKISYLRIKVFASFKSSNSTWSQNNVNISSPRFFLSSGFSKTIMWCFYDKKGTIVGRSMGWLREFCRKGIIIVVSCWKMDFFSLTLRRRRGIRQQQVFGEFWLWNLQNFVVLLFSYIMFTVDEVHGIYFLSFVCWFCGVIEFGWRAGGGVEKKFNSLLESRI